MVCLNGPVGVAMTPASWVAMTVASSHRAQIHLIKGLIGVLTNTKLFHYQTLLQLHDHAQSFLMLQNSLNVTIHPNLI